MTIELEELADFYVMDLFDLLDESYTRPIRPKNPVHGLHPEDVSPEDFKSIAQFGRIIKNYKKIKNLEDGI